MSSQLMNLLTFNGYQYEFHYNHDLKRTAFLLITGDWLKVHQKYRCEEIGVVNQLEYNKAIRVAEALARKDAAWRGERDAWDNWRGTESLPVKEN